MAGYREMSFYRYCWQVGTCLRGAVGDGQGFVSQFDKFDGYLVAVGLEVGEPGRSGRAGFTQELNDVLAHDGTLVEGRVSDPKLIVIYKHALLEGRVPHLLQAG